MLEELSKHFEIIVFTASHRDYAEKVIELLDPNREIISHSLFREHCLLTKQGIYIKDLRIINRKPKEMIIVDNALYSYGHQLANGVPIIPFYNFKEDSELLMLSEYLMSLKEEEDVRVVNNQVFKYDLMLEADNINDCFLSMFNPGKLKRGSSTKRKPSVAPKI